MMWWQSLSRSQKYRVLLMGCTLAVILAILITARAALLPFFIGLILAYLLLPAVNFLDRGIGKVVKNRRVSRPLAIVIVYIAAIGVVAGALAYFIPAVIDQGKVFAETVPGYFERLWRDIAQERDIQALFEDLWSSVPPDIQKTLETNLGKAAEGVLTGIQRGLIVTITTVSQTISFIFGMVIVPIWLFYVLNDNDRIRRELYRLIPQDAREDVRCVAAIIDNMLSSYIRGQLLLCLIVGVMAMIALVALRVNLALLLGTFAGIFEIIPVLGPYLGAIPAVLVAFLTQPIKALWVAIAFAVIQQIENMFLVPRIAGNAVRFHPALVMIIMVVGSELAGLWGILLGVPLTATFRDVFQYLYLRTTERGATPEMAMACLREMACRPPTLS